MGEYINLPDMTKEQFLQEHGRGVTGPMEVTLDELPVCLIDNGPFTAALIAYDEREIAACSDPDDRRSRAWFAVPRDLLARFMSSFALRAIGYTGSH